MLDISRNACRTCRIVVVKTDVEYYDVSICDVVTVFGFCVVVRTIGTREQSIVDAVLVAVGFDGNACLGVCIGPCVSRSTGTVPFIVVSTTYDCTTDTTVFVIQTCYTVVTTGAWSDKLEHATVLNQWFIYIISIMRWVRIYPL